MGLARLVGNGDHIAITTIVCFYQSVERDRSDQNDDLVSPFKLRLNDVDT